MRLEKIGIKNYRSIKDSGTIIVEPLQAFVGENNAGKSNILRAMQCFLTAGAGGMQVEDFNDPKQIAVFECEFGSLNDHEKKRLRPYLFEGRVILRKEMKIVVDEEKEKQSVKGEYHGYQAEPKDFHLSIAKIEDAGARPKWADVAENAGILEYVKGADGKVTKATYKAGIERYIREHDVEYDEPQIGQTHALGLATNLLSVLPALYLLPGITNYSNEIDRRSTSTVFRRLMADLSDRLIAVDPRYQEIEKALTQIKELFNSQEEDRPRLNAMSGIESSLCAVIRKLMPDVKSINLSVEVEETKEIFSKGVSIRIDDGVMTDVLDKGHGMQRNLIFSLLQLLIDSTRHAGDGERPIILAIEEPELYIHPHCQRLIFQVLKEFSGVDGDGNYQGRDQVLYTTHSPAFLEVWNYQCVGVIKKTDAQIGTKIFQAGKGVIGDPEEEKVFKILTSFGLKHNEVFFAREIVIVEGPDDEFGVIAAMRKLGRIRDLPDEIGLSIVVTGGKGEIPKFQKVLNAFGIGYGVLLEKDGHPDNHNQNQPILLALNGNRVGSVPNKVEDVFGRGHFNDQRQAKEFFSEPANINAAWELVVSAMLPAP